MSMGSVCLAPAGIPDLLAMGFGRVHPWTWVAVVFSSIFALNIAYLAWYTAVQRIGNLRTSVYSNVTPVVGMAVAALFLGEEITAGKVGGAAAILCGVAITRIVSRTERRQTDQPAAE
jgi:drug/metabolite transporter (DMT)-like permease